MTVLDVRGLRAGYREGTVLHDVDLAVDHGQVVAVLGRNGAGKTTLVHTIIGLVRPTGGHVIVDGADTTSWRTDQIARAGVALVPQGRRVWPSLTVDEHLHLAARCARRSGRWTVAAVVELLPHLGTRRRHRGAELSGGEQQMLAIARALLSNPKVLLLDEPSDGLAPAVVAQVADVVGDLRRAGTSMVLVEQDLRLACAVADDVVVIEKGRVALRCPTREFVRDAPTARRLLGVA
jgi:branched-chain amino acid transport system ATP-binding protein